MPGTLLHRLKAAHVILLGGCLATPCALAAAAPERSGCEIEARIVAVEGDRIDLSLGRHWVVVRPRMRLLAVEGEKVLGALAVERVDGSTAQVRVAEWTGAESPKVGLTVVGACPLPVTGVGERRAFLGLPSDHGLRSGTTVSAWRKDEALGEFQLVIPGAGAPYVTLDDPGVLRPGDLCYALRAAEEPREPAPTPVEQQASPGLLVTAADSDWVYFARSAPGAGARPTGRYVVKQDGESVAVIEAAPTGPWRGAVVVLASGVSVRPGATLDPLTGEESPVVAPPPTSPSPPSAPLPTEAAPPPLVESEANPSQATQPAEPQTTAGEPEKPRTDEQVAMTSPATPGETPATSRAGTPERRPPLGATFHGPTGLIRAPSAEVVPEGTWRLSATFPAEADDSTVPDFRRQLTYTLGLLPGVEVGGAFSDDRRDITMHAKVRLLPERPGRPAVAIGGSNLRPADGEANYYLVASKTFADGRLRTSLGWSTGELDGPFAGLEGRLTPWATALVEYDSNRVNAGLRLTPTERIQIDLVDMREGLSTQAAYWFDLGGDGREPAPVDLEAPKDKADAQAVVDDLAAALVALGMENVQVFAGEAPAGPTVGIFYENRRYYRDEMEALGQVLARAAQLTPAQFPYVSVVVLDHQVPVLRLTTALNDYRSYVRGDIPAGRFRDMVFIDRGTCPDLPRAGVTATTRRQSPTRLTADIRATPVVRTLFGSEEVTLATRKLVRVDTDVDLGSGWFVRAGKEWHLGGHLGLGLDQLASENHANLNYAFRADRALMGHLAGGDFADDRRGVAAEGFWLGDQAALVRGYVGWLEDRRFAIAGPDPDFEWSYLGDVRYWLSDLDVEAGLSFGKYLDGDRGYALSLRRFFGDNEVKFEFRDSGSTQVLGLDITVPIGPEREPKPSPVRLRLGDRFRSSWRTALETGTGEGSADLAGLAANQLRLFDISDDFLNRDRLNSQAIRDHLGALRTAAAALVPR